MDRFERLVDRACENLEERLLERGESREDAEGISNRVGDLGLPGLVALLSNSADFEGKLGAELIGLVADQLASRSGGQIGLSKEQIEGVLGDILIRRVSPSDLVVDSALRTDLLRALAQRAAEEAGLPITPDELDQAVELLTTGEFFEDAATSTSAIFRVIPGLPLALIRDTARLPRRVPGLLGAIVRDLVSLPAQIPSVFQDLVDGSLDRPPVVLARTLRRLFRFSTLGSVVETLGTVTSRRSVQLAITVWARANGVPIEVSDVDKVSGAIFQTENPDLGALLPVAWDRLVDRLGLEEARNVVGRLAQAA